jgi:hypothetical protein
MEIRLNPRLTEEHERLIVRYIARPIVARSFPLG